MQKFSIEIRYTTAKKSWSRFKTGSLALIISHGVFRNWTKFFTISGIISKVMILVFPRICAAHIIFDSYLKSLDMYKSTRFVFHFFRALNCKHLQWVTITTPRIPIQSWRGLTLLVRNSLTMGVICNAIHLSGVHICGDESHGLIFVKRGKYKNFTRR